MKLSIKFFLAFLITSLTIVVLMVVIMQICAYRNFSEYVHSLENGRLDELSEILSEEYGIENSWDPLRDEPDRWGYILRPRHPALGGRRAVGREFVFRPGDPGGFAPERARGPGRRGPPPRPRGEGSRRDRGPEFRPGFREGARPMGRPEPPPREFRRPGEENENRPNGAAGRYPGFDYGRVGLESELPARAGEQGRRPPAPGRKPKPGPFGIEHRLTLFDDEKIPVAGTALSSDGHRLKEIRGGDGIVGWLGLKEEDRLTQPLDLEFLKQQSQAFYITGALMLALAGVVSFLLGRHLLSPVKELTEGTRALADRKLDTRIRVRTGDELGQLAGDFNRMAETLEDYERLRKQWVSDIAHELRTPIAVLQGEIEAIQDGIREPDPQALESLHGEILHLGKIVQDLHDLSMAESGALRCRRAPVDVSRVFRETLGMFEGRCAERDIAVSGNPDEQGELIVLGDEGRLRQVFTNLFENTLRYTDAPGRLNVGVKRNGSHVLVFLEDSLPGVPDDALSRLFDRLYRVDVSRSREKGGSGLGLSIVRSIVHAHGGDIRANHSPLGGVRMELSLPLAREA